MEFLNKIFNPNKLTHNHTAETFRPTNTDIFSNDYRQKLALAYSKPVYEDLLVGEIILLDWYNNRKEDAVVPEYFAGYGINWIKSLPKLLNKQLLRPAYNLEKLAAITVKDLKDILTANSLKKTGKKDELVQRIVDNIEESEYEKYVSFNVFTLTDTGRKILEHCQILLWSHKNYPNNEILNPSIMKDYTDDKRENNSIAMDLLNKALDHALHSDNSFKTTYILSYRVTLALNMGNLELALESLLIDSVLILKGALFREIDSQSFSEKGRLIEVQNKLRLSDDALFEKAGKIFDEFNPLIGGVSLYDNKGEYLEALNTLLNGTMTEFNTLSNTWYKRYSNRYEDDERNLIPDNIDSITGRKLY